MSPLTSAQALMQASAFLPSMFMAQEPQMPSRQERRKLKRRIDLVLDLDQRVENHRTAAVHVDFVGVEARILGRVRIEAVNLEDAARSWRRPAP